MRLLKFAAIGLASLSCLALAAFAVAAWVYRDVPAASVEARYALPGSRFLDVDGVRIHYLDEGSGPPVLLLHAHYSSLRMWEPWASRLRATHRVLRLDLTSHGLTRPDPTGDYSLERGVQLLEGFTRELGLGRFALGGASVGATHAIRFAARHPEMVERLILVSPGALEGHQASARNALPGMRLILWMLEHVTPRLISARILESAFAERSKPPPELIDEWHGFWMMEGQRHAEVARMAQYRADGIEDQIRSLRMPVLLMWGEADRITRFDQAARMRALLSNASSVKLVSYPAAGHMITYEAPDQSARDVLAWLDAPPDRPARADP